VTVDIAAGTSSKLVSIAVNLALPPSIENQRRFEWTYRGGIVNPKGAEAGA